MASVYGRIKTTEADGEVHWGDRVTLDKFEAFVSGQYTKQVFGDWVSALEPLIIGPGPHVCGHYTYEWVLECVGSDVIVEVSTEGVVACPVCGAKDEGWDVQYDQEKLRPHVPGVLANPAVNG